MNAKQITQTTVSELALALRARTVSSEEIVRAYLERIDHLNPILNTVVQIAPDSAIAQSREADTAFARGNAVSPLQGIPFTVKDVYPVLNSARMIDAPGMAAHLDFGARREATVVTRLRRAGAIPIAVTRATWWSDREERYGRAYNPYNLGCEPGGSSGGEAAAIAAGGSPFGIGSDSGGSLRIPAHDCGIATLRPSNGRVPRGIEADGTNDPRTAAGPLARSVADLAIILPIIAGVDPEDPTTIPIPLAEPREINLRGLRVGVFTDNGLVKPTAETVDAVRLAAGSLAAVGADITDIEPPGLDEAWEITLEYWRYCGADGNVKDYFAFLERWDRYRCRITA